MVGCAIFGKLDALALEARLQRFYWLIDRPCLMAVLCAISAVALGAVYMWLAGAPTRYLDLNGAALALGLALLPLASRGARSAGGRTIIGAAALLIGTAFAGTGVAGALRWIALGPLVVQPGLILAPAILVLFARSRDRTSAFGIALAALAFALQPDRAMAAVMLSGVLAITVTTRDRATLPSLAASVAAFLVAMVSPDRQGAMPFVDQIVYTAFGVGLIAGLCVLGGLTLLLLPGLAIARASGSARAQCAAFFAAWGTVIAAAVVGNYPTPLVGYGGSAVLGYCLSLAVLPRLLVTAGNNATTQEAARRDEQTLSRTPSTA